jgi:hypothetical protein
MTLPVPLPPPPTVGADANTDANAPLFAYAIVDCARLDGLFYQKATQAPDITCKSLLDGTPHAESAIAGPLLVDVTAPAAQSFLSLEVEAPEAVVWLWSALPFEQIYPALQQLQFAEREDGQKLFLRYFDARNLKGMLSLFKEDPQAQQALAHIRAWAYQQDGQHHYLD